MSFYLLLYNTLSLLSWTYQTLAILAHASQSAALRNDIFKLVTPVQSVAALDVVHAALGLVKASPRTAALQVGGRNLVVWTVMRAFPDLILGDERKGGGFGRFAFVACLMAWGVADVLRFTLFVGNGLGWRVEGLRWLRYSAFIILYPVGFLSEAALVYLGLVEGEGIGPIYRGYLFLGLLSYIPASYVLYTHMFAQRRRALAQAGRAKGT
ncbi:PTPLA-domain-containing protein [Xylaria bambusicola]|uniref:PTPLA-domain-containing protein n=1 Tax=Xylaria bambusicola TaxID=326684 RepID=UPI002008739E|nr:PTPLA-domain-containing protein [Xylaria bambusicola]KAI0506160.1 PTPLA-domain-containing protein [Xylaria bambusicola]